MKKYILSIDQGTTSSRAFLIDRGLNIVGASQKEFKQYYPKPGWVEHDPEDIWSSVVSVIRDVFKQSGIPPALVAGIGITNQRETTILWDRNTGKAVCNAIVWQDRRTSEICKDIIDKGKEPFITRKSGLVVDPYFSGTKISWLMQNVEGLREKARSGDLAFGTVDSFLAWRLTGGKAHVTDVSNASRTLLMNIESCEWDEELLEILGVERSILPNIVPSSAVVGETSGVDNLPDGIPIAGMIGDQQAALFGQTCFERGMAKCTYGTGSFLLMNIGEKPIYSNERLLTSLGWQIGDKKTYVLEGSTFIAGAAVQWLKDGLGIIKHVSEVEKLAGEVSSSDGVVFVPALVGLGAPHWRPDARGVITGITRGTTAAHLARATLEGIAFQQCDLMEAMVKDSGTDVAELRVDGAAASNDLLMQIQSDLLGVEIVRPAEVETTVMGAAFLAGLAVGLWKSEAEITGHWKADRRFIPKTSAQERNKHLSHWRHTIEKIFGDGGNPKA